MTDQELYQQYLKETGQASQSEDALYQQYLQETGQNAPTEKVVNEMHPDIDFTTRAVTKTLAQIQNLLLNIYRKKQPNLQWKKDKSGEVLAKRPDETEWRRLDPRGFDVQDLTDVGYDIPAAIAQGAATAAAGLAGGAASGGLGAIPAAMGASAATGAGLEGVRQGIGSLMGIEDNLSGGDVALAGGIGAVSPLLFGTGAGAKEALKYAGKEGVKQSAEELLKTQKGLVGIGYDAAAGYVGPKVGTFYQAKPRSYQKAAGMLKEIKAADTNPEVVTLPLSKAAGEINQTLKQKATETGKRMEDIRAMIDNQPGLVLAGEGAAYPQGTLPTAQFIQPFQDLAESLSKGGARTEAQLKDIAALKRVIESEFKGLPENLTAAQVDNLRKRFKERAKQYGVNYGKSGTAEGATAGASAIDAQIGLAFENSRKQMSQSIIDRLEKMDPNLADEYAGLNDLYSRIKTVQKDATSKTKNSKALSQFLTSATKDPHAEKQMMDLVELTGLDLPELAYKDQAIKVFSKPNTAVRSLGGTTSTSRTIPLSTAGGAAGYYLGQQNNWSPFLTSAIMSTLGATAGSPAAMRKYMETNAVMRELPKQMMGYKALPYLMMNPAMVSDQGE